MNFDLGEIAEKIKALGGSETKQKVEPLVDRMHSKTIKERLVKRDGAKGVAEYNETGKITQDAETDDAIKEIVDKKVENILEDLFG